MSRIGRPPDDLVERVEQGLRDWSRLHYGREGQMRLPDMAQATANGIAGTLRSAVDANQLDTVQRVWAEDVALGAEVLAEAEMFADVPAEELSPRAVEYLQYMGRRVRERRGAELQRRVQWFIAGAGLGALVVYLVSL